MSERSYIIYYKHLCIDDISKNNITNSFDKPNNYYDEPDIKFYYHNNFSEGNINTTLIAATTNYHDINNIKEYNYLKKSIIYKYECDYMVSSCCHDIGNSKHIYPSKYMYEYFK